MEISKLETPRILSYRQSWHYFHHSHAHKNQILVGTLIVSTAKIHGSLPPTMCLPMPTTRSNVRKKEGNGEQGSGNNEVSNHSNNLTISYQPPENPQEGFI